jgi:hypothetical protein
MPKDPPQRPKKPGVKYDLTTCACLLSCFDFQQRGFVDRDDWKRGTEMMQLSEMGEDEGLWAKVLATYGGEIEGCVAIARLQDVVPMDPRISLMMRAMVASVATVEERLARQARRTADQGASRANRIILNMRRKIIEPVYHAWVELVSSKKRIGQRAAKAAFNGSLGRAWRQWSSVAEALAETRQRLRRFGARFVQQGLGRAWNAWLAVAEQRARMQAIGRRMRNQGLTRAFNAWVEKVGEGAAKQAQMRKALGRLVHRELIGCWEKWTGVAAAARRKATQLRKVARRFGHAREGAAFNSWLAVLAENRLMRKVLRRALHAGVGRAFGRWYECVEERIRLRELAMRIGRRMMNRVQAATFDSWYECIQASIEKREATLRKAIVQIHYKWVAMCFGAWSGLSQGVTDRRSKALGGALGRMRMRAAALCFEAWAESYRRAGALRAKYATRFVAAGLGAAYRTWAETSRELKRLKSRLKKIAIRMARRVEVLVLTEWHAFVKEAHGYMRVALARWVNGELNVAFLRWHEHASGASRMRRLLRKSLGRYANALLSKCFVAWVGMAVAEVSRRETLTRSALTLLSGKRELLLKNRFVHWHDLVRGVKERRNGLLRKAILRLRNQQLVSGWNLWMEHHEACRGMRRAAIAWRQAAAARAFRSWAHKAESARRLRQLGTAVLARWRGGVLTKVFLAWASHIGSERTRREQSQLRALAALSGRYEMLMQLQFCAWRDYARAAHHRRLELATKVFRRYANQAVTRCFLAWQALAASARQTSNDKMARALALLSDRNELLLRAAFVALRRAIAKQQDERQALVQKSLMRMKYGVLHAAFEEWRAAYLEAKRKRVAAGGGSGGGGAGFDRAAKAELAAARADAAHAAQQAAEQARRNDELQARITQLEALVLGMLPVLPPETPPAPAHAPVAPEPVPEPLPCVDLAPMFASLRGFGQVIGATLGAMHGLTQAVSEVRLASEVGGGAGSTGSRRGGRSWELSEVPPTATAGEAAAWVSNRLSVLESELHGQLDSALHTLRHSERTLEDGLRNVRLSQLGTLEVPLHPLPIGSVDAAASHILMSEVRSLQTQLATTRRELKDVIRTKAYRYEMAYMRTELHSFLFGGGPAGSAAAIGASELIHDTTVARQALLAADESRALSRALSRVDSESVTGGIEDEAAAGGDTSRSSQQALQGMRGIEEEELLPPRLSPRASSHQSHVPSPRPSRPASASLKGRAAPPPTPTARDASATQFFEMPPYHYDADLGGAGSVAARFGIGVSGAASAREGGAGAGCRSVGGPAPPTRPSRPRSAVVGVSPRMKALVSGEPLGAYAGGGVPMSSVAADGQFEPDPSDAVGMGWASRGHFAQQLEPRQVVAGRGSNGRLVSSRPPSAGVRPAPA